MPSSSNKKEPKKGEEPPPREIVKEIHKTAVAQGRTFSIENKKGKVVLATNFDEDAFPKLAAIGVRLMDHLTEKHSLTEEEEGGLL